MPTVYQDATDATVSFTGAGYTATPAKNGSGIDLKALTAAISDAAEKGRSTLSFRAEPAAVSPAISDKDAAATVGELNTLLSTVGFYVGTERTVPIDAATASKWLTVAPVDGKLTIRADQAAIQKSVDALPALVNRAPVNATSIVDSSGSVLDDVTPASPGGSSETSPERRPRSPRSSSRARGASPCRSRTPRSPPRRCCARSTSTSAPRR